jgi:hypothetical protein
VKIRDRFLGITRFRSRDVEEELLEWLDFAVDGLACRLMRAEF